MGSSCSSSNSKHPNDSDKTTPTNGSVSNGGGGIARKAKKEPSSQQFEAAPEYAIALEGSNYISFADAEKKSSALVSDDANQHSYGVGVPESATPIKKAPRSTSNRPQIQRDVADLEHTNYLRFMKAVYSRWAKFREQRQSGLLRRS